MTPPQGLLGPIEVGFTNVYLIDTGDGLIVIDTGSNYDGTWDEFKTGLAAFGFAPPDIMALLLTHSHGDHAGLTGHIRAHSEAKVYLHPAEPLFPTEKDWENSRSHSLRLMWQHGVPEGRLEEYQTYIRSVWSRRGEWVPPLLAPDYSPADGERLPFGSVNIQAIHCPGHTPGSMVFYAEDSGVLFTGDHVLLKTITNPIIEFLNGTYECRTRSLPDYVNSLKKIAALPGRQVCPGHGPEFEDFSGRISAILSYHVRKAGRVGQLLAAGPQTAYGILDRMYPHLRTPHLWRGMCEVIGHLDLLEDEGKVSWSEKESVFVYEPLVSGG